MEVLGFSGKFDYKNKTMRVALNMYVFKESESFIVYCPALDLSAYGDTEQQAKTAFEGILNITFQYWMNKNTMQKDLVKHGWNIKSIKQKKIKSPSIEDMIKKNESFADILNNKEYASYKQDIGIPQFA